jgi:hypothetical protein
MSHFDGSLPELTPEQESEVRRLLADARHDEPVPAEVADRLDAVLAGLTRDEPGSEGIAPVVDLAARRRRRNAAAVLAGAAAVIVAGFGIGQVIDVGSEDDTAGSSTAANADRAGAGDDQSRPEANLDQGGGSPSDTAQPGAPGPFEAPSTVLQLRSDHLETDLSRQLSSYSVQAGSSSVRTPAAKDFDAAGCPLPASPHNKFGLGELFPALFDHQPAVLALRPATGGTQQADVLDCTTAASLASVTIPAR